MGTFSYGISAVCSIEGSELFDQENFEKFG
jgi:hypothetical protein